MKMERWILAFLCNVMPTGAAEIPDGIKLTMMLPVIKFESVGGDQRFEVLGFLSESGGLMAIHRKSISSGDGSSGYWIENKKVREIGRWARDIDRHFHFGPEQMVWRGQEWIRVRAVTVPALPTIRINPARTP